ncbi:MAG TPA: OsmC family protein [Longimicrobiales bacterium]|nr:OsmC family protein [Longimicrobiales bacterium]
MEQEFAITLNWRDGYEFAVDFEQDGVPELVTDEGPPLGDGNGPTPSRLLAAAVGNCLSASLLFCLGKRGVELKDLGTRVKGTIVRNENKRLRIGSLHVQLEPTLPAEDMQRMERCLEVFRDYCIVGESVREGIDVTVDVSPVRARPAAALLGDE